MSVEVQSARTRLVPFGEELWVADGPVCSFYSFPYPTRMAVIRLANGELFVWSPVRLDADEVLEAFNEVELVHQGQRLRIDRLLRRRAGPHGPEAWWVLDYKSAAQPERDQALQAQLERYRAAVQQLHPGQPVQVAFLTGAGGVAVQGDG